MLENKLKVPKKRITKQVRPFFSSVTSYKDVFKNINDSCRQFIFDAEPKIKATLSSINSKTKKEVTIFQYTKYPMSFRPFLVFQGLAIFLLLGAFVSVLIPEEEVNQKLVIKTAIIKQNSSATVGGDTVKWTALVKKSDITNNNYLLALPKSAKNIIISSISQKRADYIAKSNNKNQLSFGQRQTLALSTSKNSFSFADLFEGLSNISPSGIEQGIELFINSQNDQISTAEDATVVDLSSEISVLPTEDTIVTETENIPVETNSEMPSTDSPVSDESNQEENVTENDITESPINTDVAEQGFSSSDEVVMIEYETPAPEIVEQETDKGKIVTVSSDDELVIPGGEVIPVSNVLAFTNIPEIYNVGEDDQIKVNWVNNDNKDVAFRSYDTNNNGKLDYVEWTIPHLSTQTFEIIFISKAFQLDQNKDIIADIYDNVSVQDNNWVTIENGQYVRVTFAKQLTNQNDITVYAKPTDLNNFSKIEAYTTGTDQLVATFVIDHEGLYRQLIPGLSEPTDLFDLKITGDIDIDYIVDPADITSDLVAYYAMEDINGTTIVDSAEGNNGSGTYTSVVGKIGDAVNLNRGNSDIITVPYSPSYDFGSGDFSVSLWVKSNNSNGEYAGLVSKRPNDGWDINLAPGGAGGSQKVEFFFGGSCIYSDVSVNDGNYHHIVATKELGILKLYVDGVNQTSTIDVGGTTVDDTVDMVLGSYYSDGHGGHYLNGSLDEIRVYSGRALAQQDVIALYSQGISTTLISHYTMDDVNGTTVVDSSGNGNDCSGTYGSIMGKIDGALYFDGYSGVNSSALPDLSGYASLSISAWVKAAGYAYPENDNAVVVGINLVDFGMWVAGGTNQTKFSYNGALSDTTLNPNTWYHLVGTYDQSDFKIYVNGVLEDTVNLPDVDFGQSPFASIGYVRDQGRDWYHFVGAVDEVRIYSGALNQTDITALYNEGGVAVVVGAALGETCTVIGDCQEGLYCGYDDGMQTNQICTNGESYVDYCNTGDQCVSGYCDTYDDDYFCTDGVEGDYCLDDSECDAGNSYTCINNQCSSGTGTGVGLGEACTVIEDCEAGLYCGWDSSFVSQICTNGESYVDSCSSGDQCSSSMCDTYNFMTCTNGVSYSDYCSTGADCATGICDTYSNHMCTNGADGDMCTGHEDCEPSGYYCDNEEFGYTYYCMQLPVYGDDCSTLGFCSGDYTCNSWSYTCTNAAVGEDCGGSGDCNSGFCDTYSNMICTFGQDGDYCSDYTECDSQNSYDCVNNQCVAVVLAAVGDACTVNEECDSGMCDSVYYGICTDAGELGYSCSSGGECNSGYCDTYSSSQCSDGVEGDGCTDDSECDANQGFTCVGNYCAAEYVSIGLVAHYTMDDLDGASVLDSSGNGYNAGGTYTSTTGAVNGAIYFDGSTVISMNDVNFPITGAQPRTATIWFKPDNVSYSTSSQPMLFQFGPESYNNKFGLLYGGNDGLGLPDASANGLYFTAYANDYNGSADTTTVSRWNFAAVTYDGTTVNVYINGSSTPDISFETLLDTQSGRVYIGSDEEGDSNYRRFQGAIDDLRIYDVVLTQQEIDALYAMGDTTAGLGEACTDITECQVGLYCGYDSNWNRVCTDGVTDSDYCNSGDQCADGYCDNSYGYCSTGTSYSSYCWYGYDCSSGICDTTGTNYPDAICSDGVNGDSCADDSGCDANQGYMCIDGYCGTGIPVVGDPCTDITECSEGGLYCGYDGDWNRVCTNGESYADNCDTNDGNQCVAYCDTSYGGCTDGVQGDYCAGDTECNGPDYICVNNQCTAGGGFGDPCTVIEDCQEGLLCGYDINWNQICNYGVTDEDLCQVGTDCASGFCGQSPSYCTSGDIGAMCGYSTDCILGYCDTWSTGNCTNGTDGDYCSNDTECNDVYGYTCVDNLCTSPLAGLGESCTYITDCQESLYCGCNDSLCWERVCTNGATGVDYCDSGDQCADGYCDNYYNSCSTGTSYESACTSGADCISGMCDTYSSWQCTDGITGFDYCSSGEECESGLCDTYSNEMCSNGQDGDYCTDDTECDSGNSYVCQDYMCTPFGGEYCGDSICNNGETCGSDVNGKCQSDCGVCGYGDSCIDVGDCSTAYCNSYNNTCSDGNSGDYCNSNSECDAGQNLSCGYDYNTWDSVCVGQGEVGYNCSSNGDCNSGYCDTYDAVCSDGQSYYAYCQSGDQCASGMCDTYSSWQCTDGVEGNGCTDDTECESGNICVNNYCAGNSESIGLVAHYTMDDLGMGTIVVDSVGGYDAVASQPVSNLTTTGVIGRALTTNNDGVDDKFLDLTLGDLSSVFAANRSWTISMWEKFPNVSSSERAGIINTTNTNILFWIYYGQRMDGIDSGIWASGSDLYIENDTWYLHTIVRTPTTLKVYLDGDLVIDATGNNPPAPTGTDTIRFGSTNAEGSGVTGTAIVDDVRIYDTVLTQQEIDALYDMRNNGELGSPCEFITDCQEGLYCGWDSGLDVKVCTEGITGLDYCTSGDQCADGYCDNWISICSTGTTGVSGCYYVSDCADGFCDKYGNICSSGGVGEGCDENYDLADQCVLEICAGNLCRGYSGGGDIGDICSVSNECLEQLYCGYNASWQQVCTSGVTGVDYCDSGDQCVEGYCDGSLCSSGTTDSSLCQSGDQCASGMCDTYSSGSCTDGVEGDYCSNGTECDNTQGYACANNYCIILADLGGPCAAKSDCAANLYCGLDQDYNRICTNGENGTDRCNANNQCANGYCNNSLGACSSGITGEDGCVYNTDCEDGYCDSSSGLCSAGISYVSTCAYNSNCQQFCDSYSTGRCTDGADGDGCIDGTECASEICTNNLCESGSTLGDPCSTIADCTEGLYCGYDDGMQTNQICTNGETGVDYCGSGNQCTSGFCDTSLTGQCSAGSNGDGCIDNNDCTVGYHCEVDACISDFIGDSELANIPGTLTLTANSVSQITATWLANANPQGTKYFAANSTASTNSGWITDLSWVSSGLTCGTSYTFTVKARNDQLVETATVTASISTNDCPGASSGGNLFNIGNSVTTVVELVQQVPETVIKQINDLAQRITGLTNNVPEQPVITYPPIEESVPEEPQVVFQGGNVISRKAFDKINILPLPESIKDLALKFPRFASTLEEVGISNKEDIEKLKIVSLKFPSLSEVVGAPSSLKFSEFTEDQRQRIPSNITFAKTGNDNIDLNIKVSITELNEPIQSISAIKNKPLYLTIKPDRQASSIKGYLVFKSSNPKEEITGLNLSKELSASIIDAVSLPKKDNTSGLEKDVVISEFDYVESNGIWTANINTPSVIGIFDIKTVVQYKEKTKDNKSSENISMILVVDPEGYIYENIGGDKEARINNAKASIYWLNPETEKYELWQAKDFLQENPQITNKTGTYSFLVPEGTYYLQVEAKNYATYKGEPFQISAGNGVHQNIELKAKSWSSGIFTTERILTIVVILGLIIAILLIFLIATIYLKKKIY